MFQIARQSTKRLLYVSTSNLFNISLILIYSFIITVASFFKNLVFLDVKLKTHVLFYKVLRSRFYILATRYSTKVKKQKSEKKDQ